MEHQNVDENVAYKTACENVKKIANAIKAIKIKYYLDFSKITEGDRKIYDELHAKMEQISSENGLNNLKVALMSDISSRYDSKNLEDIRNGNSNSEETKENNFQELLSLFFGAMDVETRALREGKPEICIECQKKRNIILREFKGAEEGKKYEDEATRYARGKLGEIGKAQILNDRVERLTKFFKKCNEETKPKDRKELDSSIQQENQTQNEKEEILR